MRVRARRAPNLTRAVWGVAFWRLYGRRGAKGVWRITEAIFSTLMIFVGLGYLGAGTYASVRGSAQDRLTSAGPVHPSVVRRGHRCWRLVLRQHRLLSAQRCDRSRQAVSLASCVYTRLYSCSLACSTARLQAPAACRLTRSCVTFARSLSHLAPPHHLDSHVQAAHRHVRPAHALPLTRAASAAAVRSRVCVSG